MKKILYIGCFISATAISFLIDYLIYSDQTKNQTEKMIDNLLATSLIVGAGAVVFFASKKK